MEGMETTRGPDRRVEPSYSVMRLMGNGKPTPPDIRIRITAVPTLMLFTVYHVVQQAE